jgi:hypothetical protein
MRATISACLIVFDEEERLPAALASVAFCDEVIVVDSGSADATAEIARAAGATVVENPWPGFAAQRNVALDRASSDWILEVDADERITPELRRSIEAFLDDPPAGIDMATLPLRHRFLGRQLGGSGKYPLYRNRLFRRGAYRHDVSRTVHEGLWANGPVVPLDGDLEHILADTWSEALGDARRYAQLDARQYGVPRGPLAIAKGLALRPAAKLGARTVVYGGWRDGWQGLTKIGLDVGTDVLVCYHALRGAGGDGPREEADTGRTGPARLVGIASKADRDTATRWLESAAELGADVSLVTDGAAHDPAIRTRSLPRLGPLLVIRALDAENQLRPIDALVTAGPAAGRLARLIPGGLKGVVPPLSVATEPAEAVALAEQGRRAG